jgi:thiamine-phosphate pyrophosphorylase
MDRLLRILDVNFNRAKEALRVLEDFARFNLSDKGITLALKEMRHKLSDFAKPIQKDLLAERCAESDIGRDLDKSPLSTPKDEDLIQANFKRLQEALRSLEEYLKIYKPTLSHLARRLRFYAYTLEKNFLQTFSKSEKLKSTRLYVILTDTITNKKFSRLAKKIVEGGADILQLRMEKLSDKKLLNLARRLRKITKTKGVLLIINNRLDIALACDADGVHLGENDIPIVYARKILGGEKIIGATSHNIREAKFAEKAGADYISVGPFFKSKLKPYLEPYGFSYIQEVKKSIKIPFFAIGGITKENVKEVLARGAERIVVSCGIILEKNPKLATRFFKNSLAF